MRFSLAVALDGAAFWTEGEEFDRASLAELLRLLAVEIDQSHRERNTIRDANGNSIGEWELEEDEHA